MRAFKREEGDSSDSASSLADWIAEDRPLTQRILHSVRCCCVYILLVHRRALQREAEHKAKVRAYRAKWARARRMLRSAARHQKDLWVVRDRHIVRDGRVSENTRNIDVPRGMNYAEAYYRSKPNIKTQEFYIGLHRWPWRDKLGSVAAQMVRKLLGTRW